MIVIQHVTYFKMIKKQIKLKNYLWNRSFSEEKFNDSKYKNVQKINWVELRHK